MTESSRRNLFLARCAVVLLHTGAHISQSYVNYPAWHLIETESFKPYHWAIKALKMARLMVNVPKTMFDARVPECAPGRAFDSFVKHEFCIHQGPRLPRQHRMRFFDLRYPFCIHRIGILALTPATGADLEVS